MQQNNDQRNENNDTYQQFDDNSAQNTVQNDAGNKHNNDSRDNRRLPHSVAYLAKLAILSAIAVVLLYIEFPLFPATPWLELNVSDVPTLLASFMFGPLSGAIVNAVKLGVCLLLRQTSTGFVGELSNLVSGSLYALIAGGVYMVRKNKVGAILSLVVSSAVFCLSMWICNQFFLLPMYGITDSAAMMPLLWWTLLFNVVKTVLTSAITFFIYKGTHKLFMRF